MTRACLPHMDANGHGRIVTMSPPIVLKGYAGRTAYNISKFGMTIVALGVAEEYEGRGITANSLWPARGRRLPRPVSCLQRSLRRFGGVRCSPPACVAADPVPLPNAP